MSIEKPRGNVDGTLAARARSMRRAMTAPERRLWWALRHRLPLEKTHFRRQVVIGGAIADFACIKTRLVVEVDGAQHGDDAARAYDEARTAAIEAAGWRVKRFWNFEVMTEMDSVIETLWALIEGKA